MIKKKVLLLFFISFVHVEYQASSRISSLNEPFNKMTTSLLEKYSSEKVSKKTSKNKSLLENERQLLEIKRDLYGYIMFYCFDQKGKEEVKVPLLCSAFLKLSDLLESKKKKYDTEHKKKIKEISSFIAKEVNLCKGNDFYNCTLFNSIKENPIGFIKEIGELELLSLDGIDAFYKILYNLYDNADKVDSDSLLDDEKESQNIIKKKSIFSGAMNKIKMEGWRNSLIYGSTNKYKNLIKESKEVDGKNLISHDNKTHQFGNFLFNVTFTKREDNYNLSRPHFIIEVSKIQKGISDNLDNVFLKIINNQNGESVECRSWKGKKTSNKDGAISISDMLGNKKNKTNFSLCVDKDLDITQLEIIIFDINTDESISFNGF